MKNEEKEIDIAYLKKRIRKVDLVIGAIGHRDLIEQDCDYSEKGERIEGNLIKVVEKKLKEILVSYKKDKETYTPKILLITSLAKGADQLVAQVASANKIDVVCLLPGSYSEFKDSLQADSENEYPVTFYENFISQEKCLGWLNVNKIISSTEENEVYENVGKFIISNSDSLVFLWDGVFTGSIGGTSVSYHQAVDGFYTDKKFPFLNRRLKNNLITIYHLSVPNSNNPYPAGKRYTNCKEESFDDYSKVYPYLWHEEKYSNPKENFKTRKNKLGQNTSLPRNRFFWMYGIPAIFAVLMTFFWLLTYLQYSGKCPWQTVESILKLIKLPGTNLSDNFLRMPNPEKWATIFGILVVTYSLLISLIYLLSNDRRILFTKIYPKSYSLILGLGWKGIELACNLKQIRNSKLKQIVAIDKNETTPEIKMGLRKGIRVIQGNFLESLVYDKIDWHKAKDIYILGNDDITNIRALQLLDSMIKIDKGKLTKEKEFNIYVHLDDFSNKFFVNKALQNKRNLKLNCFNIYENSIRRLLLKHPLDRFSLHSEKLKDSLNTVKIVILGFNEIAQALFRYCFTHCIYEKDKKVNIEVYLDKTEDIKQVRMFIPYVFKDEPNSATSQGLINEFKAYESSEVGKYVYHNFTVTVNELPQKEYDIREKLTFITNISSNEITSIFACIDDGLQSSTYLSTILPPLEIKKNSIKADLQVFCYFNFPEEKENTFIEESINRIAKTIPVFFFGNFTEEFTESAIKNHQLDKLAKLINFIYYMYYQYQKEGAIQLLDKIIDENIKTNADSTLKKRLEDIGNHFSNEKNIQLKNECLNLAWNSLDEFKKESNRIAADHVFVKLRYLSIFISSETTNLIPSNIWAEIKDSIKSFKLREGLLYTLAELEHRRWCAERIFYGWDYFKDNIPNKTEWKKSKGTVYEPLKNHIDLLPFDEIHKDEQRIDMVLIENLGLIFKMLGKYKTYTLNQANQF